MNNMKIDLSLIPINWFLYKLCDIRMPIKYIGEIHESTDNWGCELQHIKGGRLTSGQGDTPQKALDDAINNIMKMD